MSNNITIKDVANQAGVSVATVSHVINETRYVSPELTERVNEAMEKFDYKPSAIARSLKTERTHTIGLIVSDISNPFFSSLLRGAEDFALENHHSLMVCNTDETVAKEKLYIDVLLQRKIDGLIIAPTGKTDENLIALRERDIPFVFIDRRVQGVQADAVLSDNFEGARVATKHLIDCGHRNIGIILGLKSVSTSEERFEGYRQALRKADLEYDPELVQRGQSKVAGGTRAVEDLLSLEFPPTAIFSTNNLMTIGAMQGIQKSEYSCPEGISLVGFDDFEWASTFNPQLTTVAQVPYEIGARAVGLLFNRMQDRSSDYQEVRIPTELKIRNSTAHLGDFGGDRTSD